MCNKTEGDMARERNRYQTSKSLCSLFLIFSLLFPSLSQAALTLGSATFSYPPAKALNNPLHLSQGLNSYGFLSSIGGVAFGQTAKPKGDLALVGLSYDATAADGKRLSATFKDGKGALIQSTANIYDWQLIPIIRYANSGQDSAFTLFGRLADDQAQAVWENDGGAKGQRILNYHPAFIDTLMGMRLFQADILVFMPMASDLPRDNGKYLLGKGEQPPNLEANTRSFLTIGKIRDTEEYRSYVVCDYKQEVHFTVSPQDNSLLLSGDPHWYFWNDKIQDVELRKQALEETFKGILQDEVAAGIDLDSKVDDAKYMDMIEKKLDSKYVQLHVAYLDGLSRKISKEMSRIGGINPEVYKALQVCMRYSAFFRYAKSVNAPLFAKLVESTNAVTIAPPVKTPTLFAPPLGTPEGTTQKNSVAPMPTLHSESVQVDCSPGQPARLSLSAVSEEKSPQRPQVINSRQPQQADSVTIKSKQNAIWRVLGVFSRDMVHDKSISVFPREVVAGQQHEDIPLLQREVNAYSEKWDIGLALNQEKSRSSVVEAKALPGE